MEILRGKNVFVTGASSGIGLATARAFAAQGARLLVCGRRMERLQQLAVSLTDAEDVMALRLDVRDREAVEQTLADLPAEWREIDVLVNNAGLSRGLNKLYQDDVDNWEEMIDTNLKGLLYVTRAVVPGMVERERGQVINLGSIAGHQTYPGGGVYCATKAGERAISDGLRLDLIGTPVRVTSIDPGMVETEFSEVRFRGDRARAEKVYRGVKVLQAEDIADTIVWVAQQPPHVHIHTILLTGIDQASATVVNRPAAG